MTKDFSVYLQHIRDNIAIIRLAEKRGKEAVFEDILLRNAILHCLQIIGEAARSLPPSFKKQHSSVPWSKIIALRNQIAHYYHGIDFETIWKIVENRLPALETFIEAILKETKP